MSIENSTPSLKLRCKLVLPAAKSIGPSLDRVFVNTAIVKRTGTTPAIVIDKTHWRFVPAGFAENAPFQKCGDDVVTILENVRLDDEIVAGHGFDRIATTF